MIEHNWEKFYALKSGDVFVEAGAFTGEYGLAASKKVGDNGKVVLIEPDPNSSKIIEKTIKEQNLSNIILVKKAIWNKKDIVKFDIHTNPVEHKIISDNSNIPKDLIIEVEADTLDNILTELNIDNVDLFACDIEGTETELETSTNKYFNEKRIKNVAIAAYHIPGYFEILKKLLNNKGYIDVISDINPQLVVYGKIGDKQMVGILKGDIIWADYTLLLSSTSFLLTMELYKIETSLGRAQEHSDAMHPTRRMEYPWVYTKLFPLSKDEIILDVGTGKSLFPLLIGQYVKEIHTIDKDTESVDYLKKKVQMTNLQNITIGLGDAKNMQFASNTFNKVYSISIIEHMPKEDAIHVIDEMLRVVKIGGRVIITMDVMIEDFDKQIDLNYLCMVAEHYKIPINTQIPVNVPIFRVPPYNRGFLIACLELVKDKTKI